jgi:hypothetical protein
MVAACSISYSAEQVQRCNIEQSNLHDMATCGAQQHAKCAYEFKEFNSLRLMHVGF